MWDLVVNLGWYLPAIKIWLNYVKFGRFFSRKLLQVEMQFAGEPMIQCSNLIWGTETLITVLCISFLR